MDKLKRYAVEGWEWESFDSDNGSWCLYSDVEKLEAELAQVKADLRTVRERIKGLESIQIHGGTEGWRMCDYDYQAMSNTLAEIRRILNEKEARND